MIAQKLLLTIYFKKMYICGRETCCIYAKSYYFVIREISLCIKWTTKCLFIWNKEDMF